MSNEINIEEIMKEIRQNIKDRGYDKEPLSFEEIVMSKPAIQSDGNYNAEDFMQELDYLNRNWCNLFPSPVNGRNPVAVMIKKIVRRLTNFIVFPLVNFQNAYNASNIRCLNQVKEYMAELEDYKTRIEQLEKEIEQIKGRSK